MDRLHVGSETYLWPCGRAIVRVWGCVIPPPFQYCGHEGWAGVPGNFQGPPPCRSGWPKWPPSSNSTNLKKKSRPEAMVARASVRSRVPFSERFLRARSSLGPGAPLAKAQRPRRNIRDSAWIRRLLFMGEKGASTGPSWGPYQCSLISAPTASMMMSRR